jgi:glycoside hydrolase-like protein
MLALAAILPASASAKTVHFRGDEVRVPTGWPVIRLAERPQTCVRLDRRAVYLGTPSTSQRCPANAIGRRRAILVDPSDTTGDARASRGRVPLARLSAESEFTGLGFDACATPSRRTMSAWGSSPYRAIGVYIGGLNRACSQPNLTASWVAEQVAGGWHLIPTYVGLQAPTSSCGSCAKLSTANATSQGSAAAIDAVNQARAIGIGPGSPIYFDMESYSRTSSATNATLTFLAAWTSRLHALGYVSGVYSSGASGIADLASRLGSGYLQPDHIWIANWDGRKTADDPYVPDDAWSEHQRIRQYRGGHDETWGGVTINVDNNYVEGATAGSSTGSEDDPLGRLDWAGSPLPGQVRVVGWAFDPNAPGKPLSIRAYVGGKPGRPGVVRQELGAIASQPRPDVSLAYSSLSSGGGFDISFATVKSGREAVCLYAVDVGPGSDRPLGCRTIGVAIPISLWRLETSPNAVRVGVKCEWPAGIQCPGQIILRTRVRVRAGSAGRRPPRMRVVRTAVGRRPFRLTGGNSHAFHASLSSRGLELTSGRDEVRAQLVIAIPDGRIVRPVVLRRPGG